MKVPDTRVGIQRLTALWAFGECGLGGVMHALQIPFTGLVVGAVAIICITLISVFCEGNYRQLFKSLLVVLIVKAVVSPHTPFPAYIAVSFQAVLAFSLFSVFRVNWFSIMFLSIIAMIESAVQKLLLVTFFFGRSFWTGMDEFLVHITRPFHFTPGNGSWWVIGAYVVIYLTGGFYTGILAHRLVSRNVPWAPVPSVNLPAVEEQSAYRKYRGLPFIVIGFSLLLLMPVFSGYGFTGVIRSLAWTVSALLAWYLFLSPFITRMIQRYLLQREEALQLQAGEVISFLPVLRQLARHSWEVSDRGSGSGRVSRFLFTLFAVVVSYKPEPKQEA